MLKVGADNHPIENILDHRDKFVGTFSALSEIPDYKSHK